MRSGSSTTTFRRFPRSIARSFPRSRTFAACSAPSTRESCRFRTTASTGFLGAYWRRPEAYLDPGVRAAISGFTKLADVEPGLARLRADLADGTWEQRHGHVRRRDAVDLGYRLIVAEKA